MPISSSLNEQILVIANRFWTDESGTIQPERESIIENRHLGWLTVTDRLGNIQYSTPGATETATFFRSSGKPFQALPLVESGFHQEMTTEELAMTCASHTSSSRHMQLASAILKKAGMAEDDLQCGPHAPADPDMVSQLYKTGQAPTKLFNNCSGKHAGMLFYCHKAGLDPKTYLQPQHPLQVRILEAVKQWGGIEDVPLAIDGCGAPVFYLPLVSMARMYAHLGTSPEFQPLRHAMTTHPELIGGQDRVDTAIMQASQGKLLAKVGADGVLCVTRIDADQGLALKLSDGSAEVRDMALVQILVQLGWLTEEALQDARIKPFLDKQLRKNTQKLTVGKYQVLLPPIK